MDKLRVFVSYSHEDRLVVDRIVEMLRHSGLDPMYDQQFAHGLGFPDEIKSYIAHAHVFVPVVTEASSLRGWVHQEIGYAMALRIPVLPVVIGDCVPPAMIRELLAARVAKDLCDLHEQVTLERFTHAFEHHTAARALYECAPLTQDRARMLKEYCGAVRAMKRSGVVRQEGALSSFHIPGQDPGHAIWDQRYGPLAPTKDRFHRELLSAERDALVWHAKSSGCRIIVDPSLEYTEYGPEARRVRLGCLADFLESDEVRDVEVAVDCRLPVEDNAIMVGTFFCAQSVAGAIGQGYRQTIFTRHAPTLEAMIERFDKKFEELLREAKWSAASSRLRAAEQLRVLMGGL